MELTKERSILIIAGGIAIAILGLYFLLYRPVINKLRTAGLECKAFEAETSQIREAIATLNATDTRKGLIKEGDVSLAIDELTRQGKLKGINFVSMTSKQIEKQDAPYRILPIEMEIESTYKAVGMFLGLLDELKESLVTVRSFDITSDKKNQRNVQVKLTIDMYLEK